MLLACLQAVNDLPTLNRPDGPKNLIAHLQVVKLERRDRPKNLAKHCRAKMIRLDLIVLQGQGKRLK